MNLSDIQEIKSVLWLLVLLFAASNSAPLIICIIPAVLSVGYITMSFINYNK